MPIKSYLAIAKPGLYDSMVSELREESFGEVHEADDRSLAVLVTDTANGLEEKDLEDRLKSLTKVQCLTLVYGHSDGEVFAC